MDKHLIIRETTKYQKEKLISISCERLCLIHIQVPYALHSRRPHGTWVGQIITSKKSFEGHFKDIISLPKPPSSPASYLSNLKFSSLESLTGFFKAGRGEERNLRTGEIQWLTVTCCLMAVVFHFEPRLILKRISEQTHTRRGYQGRTAYNAQISFSEEERRQG